MITAQLITTLAIHGISGIALLATAIFVFFQNKKKHLNQFLALNLFAVFIYEMGMVFGPLMPTYELAYLVWFTNIVDVFITIAAVFTMLAVIEKLNEWKWYLLFVCSVGFFIFISALLFPTMFLPSVVSKLYFPWYLDGGPLYIAMVSFFIFAPLVPYIKMLLMYMKGYDRLRIEYFLLMYALGYGLGVLNFALVFNIPIDPLWGSPIGLGLIPLAYGIVAKNLLDIRVVFAKAALYSSGVALLAAFLALLISLNNIIVTSYPWVQFWTVPISTALVAFIVGRFFWFKFLENDRVKYEFITVATHKLRTPLTQISWGARMLIEQNPTPEVRAIVEHIQKSNNRLIELTNLLFETTEESTQSYAYQKERVDLVHVVTSVCDRLAPLVETKKLSLRTTLPHTLVVQGDTRRLTSVVEVLLENAINYSPHGGVVELTVEQKGATASVSVQDQGIGVSPDEQSRIFTRFYRTDAAKRADTEGVGLGLAMAKNIITRHRGKIGMTSPGEGKGSTFWFTVPR